MVFLPNRLLSEGHLDYFEDCLEGCF